MKHTSQTLLGSVMNLFAFKCKCHERLFDFALSIVTHNSLQSQQVTLWCTDVFKLGHTDVSLSSDVFLMTFRMSYSFSCGLYC